MLAWTTRPLAPIAAGVLVAFILLGLVTSACAPTPRDRQLAAAKHLTPSHRYASTSRAAEEIAKPDEVVQLRVRVYASAGYRAETVRWRERIREQLEAASQVTREQFGFELQLVHIVEWQPKSDASKMGEVLAELAERDPADDVDFVIGMTRSMGAFEPSLHLLGMADIFGQHIVLRAMNDSAEREQLAQSFDELTKDELERLYTSRLRHKETSVVLHELGHALGAVHTRDPDTLMSSMSRSSQRTFGPANTRIVRLAIELRTKHDSHDAWRRAFVEVLLDELDGEYRADFDPKAREFVAKLAAAHLDVNSLSRREVKRVNRARKFIQQGRHDKAWQHLEPLAKARPDNAHVAGMACFLQGSLRPDADETLERCRSAYEIAPDDPASALFLAHIHIDRDEMAEAVAITAEARRRLEAAEKVHAQHWVTLGRAYANLGSLTLAEQAVERAPMVVGTSKLRHYIDDRRNYFGLHKGAVPAEDEADLVARLGEIKAKIKMRQYDEVDTLVSELRNTYADVGAVEAVGCELAVVTKAKRKAKKVCARALELDDDSALAHLMSGYLAMNQRDLARAQSHLEKARDLVPRDERLWAPLAHFYKAAGKTGELKKLQKDYKQRFGKPLAVK